MGTTTPTARTARRTFAMMGGSTAADCAVALGYAATRSRLVSGPAIPRFEADFAARIGVRHGVSFAAARVGFYGLLGALDVAPGDEVLIQAPTHAVVVNAIRYRGAVPVFVDCEPRTCNIDLDAAERLLGPRSRVLVVQHTFGVPADLDRALALAERHGLVVLEDCVHSLGSTFRGRPIGSFGRAAFFSSEETKTISTTQGGMVVTDDDDLAGALRRFQRRDCVWVPPAVTRRYLVKFAAYWALTQPDANRVAQFLFDRMGRRNPFPRPADDDERRGRRPPSYERRLSNAQARLGVRALRRLDANVGHRRRIAAIYADRLPLGGGLGPGDARMNPSYVRYPVVVRDRAEALAALGPHVTGDTWFDQTVQGAESVDLFGYPPWSCPCAEYLAGHLVDLPTHLRVLPRDAEYLADLVAPLVVPAEPPHD
ncbi:MAG: DegT/DnrJ/EryC1/StrS aminotransferase family protein [Acidimicrobiales bacterium]|jgi:dTDP-4-amino-4,6-dideoxygalactose transaminase|nr:DegT/DnrJ/EryC1/StrS aminotransferase family protein [Acidimicrobiales bacterium]